MGSTAQTKEDEEAEEEEIGARNMRRKAAPHEPTADERHEHELTHLSFRSWCRHCIRGRGKEESSQRTKRDEGGIPEVHMDYMFMGEEHEGGSFGNVGDTRA